MKRNTIILFTAIALSAASSFAGAGQSLAPVNVIAPLKVDCTPPNSQAVCAAWHETIRRNFSQREIGLLFGARTSYPGYQTSYPQVKARYDALQDQFAVTHAADLGNVASR